MADGRTERVTFMKEHNWCVSVSDFPFPHTSKSTSLFLRVGRVQGRLMEQL